VAIISRRVNLAALAWRRERDHVHVDRRLTLIKALPTEANKVAVAVEGGEHDTICYGFNTHRCH
jgi:hypothetical protein